MSASPVPETAQLLINGASAAGPARFITMTTALCCHRQLNIEQRVGAWRIPALLSHQCCPTGSRIPQGPCPATWSGEPSHPRQGQGPGQAGAMGSAGDPSPGRLGSLSGQSRAPVHVSRDRESPAGPHRTDQPCSGCSTGTLPALGSSCPACRKLQALSALASARCTPGTEDMWYRHPISSLLMGLGC